MLESSKIKELAHSVGFDLCGVARTATLSSDADFLRQWIAEGKGSSLAYMQRNIDKRCDIGMLVEDARTVIVCGIAYKNRYSDGYESGCYAKVASYALMEDYHTTIKGRLMQLKRLLEEYYGKEIVGRAFVDSAPVFEKRYAVEAGLGWIGRQSLLVTPQYGTFVLLGELVVAAECDEYDSPYRGVGCGECRRCEDACPNGAIEAGHIDTRRCISRLTIERESAEDDAIDTCGWIFGCDECQSVCPYNRQAPYSDVPLLFDPLCIDWEALNESDFAATFIRTPLGRSSIERIRELIAKHKKA